MTLVEAVAALSLLSLICLMFLPIYSTCTKEHHAVNETKTALYLLEKEAYQTRDHLSTAPSGGKEDIYTWEKNSRGAGTDICVSWEGANHRHYEKCLFVLEK